MSTCTYPGSRFFSHQVTTVIQFLERTNTRKSWPRTNTRTESNRTKRFFIFWFASSSSNTCYPQDVWVRWLVRSQTRWKNVNGCSNVCVILRSKTLPYPTVVLVSSFEKLYPNIKENSIWNIWKIKTTFGRKKCNHNETRRKNLSEYRTESRSWSSDNDDLTGRDDKRQRTWQTNETHQWKEKMKSVSWDGSLL